MKITLNIGLLVAIWTVVVIVLFPAQKNGPSLLQAAVCNLVGSCEQYYVPRNKQ